VDTGFRKRSCSNNLERDDDSKKSHHALVLRHDVKVDAGFAEKIMPGTREMTLRRKVISPVSGISPDGDDRLAFPR
jgi:hypothetical protein